MQCALGRRTRLSVARRAACAGICTLTCTHAHTLVRVRTHMHVRVCGHALIDTQVGGGAAELVEPLRPFGDALNGLVDANGTGGYSIFAQDLPPADDAAEFMLPCADHNGVEAPCSSSGSKAKAAWPMHVMHAHMYVRTHACTHTSSLAHLHSPRHVCILACMYIYTLARACTHIRMHAHTHAHVQTCMGVDVAGVIAATDTDGAGRQCGHRVETAHCRIRPLHRESRTAADGQRGRWLPR